MRRIGRSNLSKGGTRLVNERRLVLEHLENRRLLAGFPFSLGGTGSEYGHAVATDSAGNVFVAGKIDSATDFDPGPGTANLAANGGFLAKYAADGAFVWARTIGGGGRAPEVTVDALGNAYLAAYFTGSTTITGINSSNVSYTGPSLSSHSTVNRGKVGYQQDGLALKFDPSGSVQWASQFGGTNLTSAQSVDIHAPGGGAVDGVLVSGQFNGTVDFDPGAGVTNLTSAGSSDAYVAKLDASSGALTWVVRAGSTGEDGAYGIDLANDGSALVTGHFTGSNPFGSSFPLSSNGDRDTFLAKLNSDGTVNWVRGMGGAGWDKGYRIGVASESIYLAGRVDLLTYPHGTSISKWNMNGDVVWTKQLGGGQDGVDTWGLTIDPLENVYVYGYYGSDDLVDFDPGAAEYLLPDLSVDNGFVVKFDAGGNFGGWATRMGSHVRGAAWDSHSQTLVVTGQINGNSSSSYQASTRDASAGPILSSNGVWDVFAAKLDVATGLPAGYTPVILVDMDAQMTGNATTSGKNWRANATVNISANGQPLAGATVTATWGNSSTVVTGTTNSNGTVTFTSSNLAKSVASVDLTIVSVQKSGFKYTGSDAIRIFQTGGIQPLSTNRTLTLAAPPIATSSQELSVLSGQIGALATKSGAIYDVGISPEFMQLSVADLVFESKRIESLFVDHDEDDLMGINGKEIDDELVVLLATDPFVPFSSSLFRSKEQSSHK
ncbi:MAG: hypothetical protein ABL921_01150 [Pirellula sp.]